MNADEPKKVRLYKRRVKAFQIRKSRERSLFLLTGATSERNGRESYNIIYSMPAEEGALFTMRAQRAVERRKRGFSLKLDYLYATNISTVAYVNVPAPSAA